MRRALCVMAFAAACSRGGDGSAQAAAAASPAVATPPATEDSRFRSEWQQRVPVAVGAFQKLADELKAGRCAKRDPGCAVLAKDAGQATGEVAQFAAAANVSVRLEPARGRTEAGFGLLSAAMANALRYYETGNLDGIRRATKQMPVALTMLTEAKTLLAGTAADGPMAVAAPPGPLTRAQAQRDLATVVTSQGAHWRIENAALYSIAHDQFEKDVAVAEARGEIKLDEWALWKAVLTYRRVQDFWKLDKVSVCNGTYGDEAQADWLCDSGKIR